MATSGTIGQTQIDAASMIDHAARRCGVLPSLLTGEQLDTARNNLFIILTALTNRGLNLWCIKKHVVAAVPYLERYALPVGVVDVMTSLWRYGTYTAATSYALATAIVDYGVDADTNVVSGFVSAPASGNYSLVIDSSDDGVVWIPRGTASYPGAVIGDLLSVDSESAVLAQFWRLRETVLLGAFADASFTSAATEIPMSKLNKNDYQSLPNKNFSSTQVLQFWYDKQDTRPYAWVWPTAQSRGPQFVLWTQTQIQDVGDLSNQIQVPQRWFNAIINELAAVTALELPAEMVKPERVAALPALAEATTRSAEDGERDGAPIRIVPGIGVYTRG